MASTCLLVLCGIPGAGKTTWAKHFLAYAQEPEKSGNIAEFSITTASAIKETGFSVTCKKRGKEGEGETNRMQEGQKEELSFCGRRYRVIHIAFDELIPEEVEAELIRVAKSHSKEIKGACWKTYRKAIAKCVNDFLQEISLVGKVNEQGTFRCQKHDGTDNMQKIITDAMSATQITENMPGSKPSDGVPRIYGCFDRHGFGSSDCDDSKNSLMDAEELDQVNVAGQELLANVTMKLKEMFNNVLHQQTTDDSICWVVIIDDNMYYSSMRYEFFQIARKYTSGFAQVYFPVEVATALRRNQKRKRRVEEPVICEMFHKLEQPCAQNTWERYTAIWKEVDSDHGNFEKILRLIDEATADPMMPVFDDRQCIEESRMICSTSLLHQADVVLRKILGSHLAGVKDVAKSKAERSHLAVSCNSARLQILDNLRNHSLLIPTNVSLEIHNAPTCAENPFHLLLKDVFHQQLKQIS